MYNFMNLDFSGTSIYVVIVTVGKQVTIPQIMCPGRQPDKSFETADLKRQALAT